MKQVTMNHNVETPIATEDKLVALQRILTLQDDALISDFLRDYSEAEIAQLLGSFPLQDRQRIWLFISDEIKGEVLARLTEEVRASLMSEMKESDVCELTQDLGIQEVADILDTTDDSVKDAVIGGLDDFTREKVQAIRAYEDDAVGRYMNPVTVNVKENVSLETVQRYVRINNLLDDDSQEIMVTNKENHLVGSISLVNIVKQQQDALVSEFTHLPDSILDVKSIHDAAVILRAKGLHFAPVVDEYGLLVGQLNVDDIIGITREDSENTLMNMAGVSENEELFAPIMRSTRSRGIWLGINLATAFLAAYVIGQFEAVISQVVALAVLMPVVASMGGIAGSQTLSVIMRGLAIGQIAGKNRWWLFNKELWVGALNGILWAIVVGVVAQFWFNELMVSLVIALAIAINMTVANVSGIAIPLVLKKMNIDPALSGAVILTTVTDVVGFMSFLGLATLLILT